MLIILLPVDNILLTLQKENKWKETKGKKLYARHMLNDPRFMFYKSQTIHIVIGFWCCSCSYTECKAVGGRWVCVCRCGAHGRTNMRMLHILHAMTIFYRFIYSIEQDIIQIEGNISTISAIRFKFSLLLPPAFRHFTENLFCNYAARSLSPSVSVWLCVSSDMNKLPSTKHFGMHLCTNRWASQLLYRAT